MIATRVTTLCFEQNCKFSLICQSILNGLHSNLHKVGLIFREDWNKWSQPYVSSKTAHFHQYLSQFLTDCLQTFTKWVNFSRRSQQGQQPYVLSKTTHFYSNPLYASQSILNRLSPNLYKVLIILREDRKKWSQPYVSSKTRHFHQYLSQFLTDCCQTFKKLG